MINNAKKIYIYIYPNLLSKNNIFYIILFFLHMFIHVNLPNLFQAKIGWSNIFQVPVAGCIDHLRSLTVGLLTGETAGRQTSWRFLQFFGMKLSSEAQQMKPLKLAKTCQKLIFFPKIVVIFWRHQTKKWSAFSQKPRLWNNSNCCWRVHSQLHIAECTFHLAVPSMPRSCKSLDKNSQMAKFNWVCTGPQIWGFKKPGAMVSPSRQLLTAA